MQSDAVITPPPEEKEPLTRLSPQTIRRIAVKHRVEIALITILGSIAAYGIVRMMPNVYKAETLILVESQKIPEKLVSSTVNSELQDRLATISQQVLSSTRLGDVITKLNLYQDDRKSSTQEEIIERMRKDINIKLERGWTRNQPGAFRISYMGSNPETVAAVVNQLGSFFIEENLRSRELQASGTSEFLTSQLQESKKSLDALEAKVAQYKSAHNMELPEQQNSLLSGIGGMQVQLQGNQDALLRAQQNKTMLESSLAAAQSAEAVLRHAIQQSTTPITITRADGTVVSSPASAPPSKDLEDLRQRLATLKVRFTDTHPDVVTTQATINALEARDRQQRQLAAASAALPVNSGRTTTEEVTRQASPELTRALLGEQERIANLKAQVSSSVREIEVRSADRQKLLGDMNGYQARVERLPIREQEMAGLLRDYQIAKGNYESILKKSYDADMASDMEKRQKAERFTVMDPPRVPEKPAKPNRRVLIPLGCMIALGCGLTFAFVRALSANVILGEWELPEDVVVLGRVPVITSQSENIV